MANRDLSPSAWTSPGTAVAALDLTLSATSNEPLPLDQFINNFSPSSDVTVTTANATFQTFAALAPSITANTRFILVIPPAGNTTAWTVKGVTGDTGIPIHPNGFFFACCPTSIITYGMVTTGAAITGMRIITG